MPAATGASVPVLADRAAARWLTGRWADLLPRLASAIVLLPLALLCVWAGGLPWAALLLVCLCLLTLEFAAMSRAGNLPALARASGIAYFLLALVSLIWLRHGNPAQVVLLLAAVWATDIGAYLAGRWIGGPRMAPSISPGKTWSGAAGGLLAAVLVALALAAATTGAFRAGPALLALVLSLAAQAGDLLESAVKRRCGVKDSGRLIPGHGGLLDRVDGILAAAPVLALLELWLGRGNGL
jgi:phosphatidate cytidylyltransferase